MVPSDPDESVRLGPEKGAGHDPADASSSPGVSPGEAPPTTSTDREVVLPGRLWDTTEAADAIPIADRASGEAAYAALRHIATTAMIALDRNARIVYWPPEAERLAGYEADDVLGKRLHVWYARDALAEREPARTIRDSSADGHAVLEGWRSRKDGVWIWAHEVFVPRRDALGKITGFVVVIQDLTAQRRATEALLINEKRWRALIDSSSDVIVVFGEDSVVRYASPALERVLGVECGDAIGHPLLDLIHPEDASALRRCFKAAVDKPGDTVSCEVRFRHVDGGYRVLSGAGRNLLGMREVGGIVMNFRDVTPRRSAEEALQRSEERFRLLVEGSEAIFFYLLDLNGHLQYVSPGVRPVTGYAPEDLFGRAYTLLEVDGITDPEVGQARVTARIAEMLRSGDLPMVRSMELRHRDGHQVSLELVESLARVGHRVTGLQGYARDVTPQRQLEEQLRHRALHDTLTGLPNRALLEDRLEQSAQLVRRDASHHFAVLTIDLDRFKLVNDSFGHAIGDMLLTAAANRIVKCVRPGDTVARFGGDEFTVLVDPVHDAGDATRVARRVIAELSIPFVLDGREVFVPASIGIALSQAGYDRPPDLMRNADIALYRAKSLGRGRYELFDREMRARSLERLRLETALRRLVERRELRLEYQPIIELATGRVVAFEALARWPRTSHGEYTPEQFIPVAEDTGIIVELDQRTIESACQQLVLWQGRHPGRSLAMSVNLSGRLLARSGLVERIGKLLERVAIAPGTLRMEITESVLIERATREHAVLEELQRLGVKLYLDDFGTGFSSLGYLARLPVDGLKLDRSLVRDGGNEAKIMRAVLALASGLELEVVAEGVEDEQQLTHLRTLGCTYAQGFFIARPLEGAAASALLERDPRW